MEIWKDVFGYEDLFQVSNFGNLKSKRTNKILKQHKRKNGYMTVSTRIGGRNGKCLCFKVHRLVAQTFINNPENKPYVNHIDGQKDNNYVDNLEWVTPKENTDHAIMIELMRPLPPQDYNKKHRKLTRDQVLYIRRSYVPYDRICGARALALRFNVSKNRILKIISGETYSDFQ